MEGTKKIMVRSAEYQKPPTGTPTVADEAGKALFFVLERAIVGVAHVVWWAVLFPMLSLPLAGAGALWWWRGWSYGVGAVAFSGAMWMVWWAWWPGSWRRWVSGRVRGRYLSWKRYKVSWNTTLALNGLTAMLDNGVLTPRLVSISIGDTADILKIKMLKSQTVDDWADRADALRNAFGAIGVRVRTIESGWVRLEVIQVDRLTEPIPLPRVEPDTVDLEALAIGLTELGELWRIRLLGNQLLVAGATGSGKGSVVWATIAALGPAIRAGVVQVWVLDPKGGMEFGAARRWFARFAYDNGPGALKLLQDAAAMVQGRGESYMDSWARKITPSVKEPLIFLIIDEAASVSAYFSDRKIRDEILRLLGDVLSKSRAVAVPVMGCLQDPSKEVIPLRQLFPTRLGLRMKERTQPDMALGDKARDRGALCDQIPMSMPGVGYVEYDESPEITRVRAYHVTDDDIRWIMTTYPPPHCQGKNDLGKDAG
ncbi:cell division protein FtsK [Nocardia sp. XZ_19_369]|uniref:cell division protein FtsK n=1 Tax=Nocardia sp. XZ_19_369 TaxID=2769487 RepID=UPI0018907702|nr:cell division protein FtsK [Nocardia sp. XZ_19_369]